jgi:DNA-binding response OmpR family regulator
VFSEAVRFFGRNSAGFRNVKSRAGHCAGETVAEMKKICKVLIVEDDKDIQDLVTDTLSGEGYHFTVAGTGAEMRMALASDPGIDIVVVDLHLPGGVNGLILAQEAAAQGLPVIVVSGDHSRIEEIEKSGHRHIMKPYRLSSFLQIIDETLKATKANCERESCAA